jgi:hypothetical protein
MSSPATIGVPALLDSSTCVFQGSPPAMDMTSLRIVEDGLASMSTALTNPSSVSRWIRSTADHDDDDDRWTNQT